MFGRGAGTIRKRVKSALRWRKGARPNAPSFSSASSSAADVSNHVPLQKTADGYQSIGSFHSENLAELMNQSDEDYVPPELPFEDADRGLAVVDGTNDNPSSDFLLDPSWTFLNHGAFGAALRMGFHRANAWRTFLEAQPLRYFDRYLLPHLAHSTRLLADFIGAPRTDVAPLPNVTSGLNSVLAGYARYHSQSSNQGVNVVLFDTAYGSVKKMVQCYFGSNNDTKHRIHEIPLQKLHLHRLAHEEDPEAVLEELLLDALQSHCGRGQRTLLLLDHTSSNTAITFPIARLAQAAKQHHGGDFLDVVVDGAHGLLAQEVNLHEHLIPHVDAYLTNAHKWFSAPRGVALLYAQPEWHGTVLRHPAVVSHGADEPDLLSRYAWDGCRDYAAALSLPCVVEHWNECGPARVRQQVKDQLQQGISVVVERWHPGCADLSDWAGRVTLVPFLSSSLLSPMALVALPLPQGLTSTDAKRLQDALYGHRIEVPVKCINGSLYVRLSCHVYNQLEDFDRLGLAISSLKGG